MKKFRKTILIAMITILSFFGSSSVLGQNPTPQQKKLREKFVSELRDSNLHSVKISFSSLKVINKIRDDMGKVTVNKKQIDLNTYSLEIKESKEYYYVAVGPTNLVDKTTVGVDISRFVSFLYFYNKKTGALIRREMM